MCGINIHHGQISAIVSHSLYVHSASLLFLTLQELFVLGKSDLIQSALVPKYLFDLLYLTELPRLDWLLKKLIHFNFLFKFLEFLLF